MVNMPDPIVDPTDNNHAILPPDGALGHAVRYGRYGILGYAPAGHSESEGES